MVGELYFHVIIILTETYYAHTTDTFYAYIFTKLGHIMLTDSQETYSAHKTMMFIKRIYGFVKLS